ncbi:putative ribonuclease H-like domain-containing protein [Tanacetum coccineum]|uniref:Ribonuclease H-like domain-containing protein n=1 Tax=Tanacetum coccineum TaxID=301880 RepID=A0ABQ5GFS0_9ASTR
MTHPHSKGIFFPKAVLVKSGIKILNTAGQNFSKAAVSVNTARPINTTYPGPTLNSARTALNVFNRGHSHVRRSFKGNVTTTGPKVVVSDIKGNVTTDGLKAVVSDNKGNEANAVKASACWVWRPKQKVLDHVSRRNGASMNFKRFEYVDAQGISKSEKGVIKSECSRHMTGNKFYLLDYEEIYGGFVAFGGDPKEGRITGKGKISTSKLDFEDMYFVKELKFNLFNVSQMCDKKNNVLLTDTECVVLSPDIKLLDENHVLLRVPRKDNMYSVDFMNIVPSRGLTCRFAKATLDESNLWHRRFGHINFKTMNKLVRGNLVRGLPSKIFKNNHTCVACEKGKQHKASCKTKTVSSISQSLQMLHMDLFGPTFVKSLMKTMYCLVVIDDYNLKVKVIGCDNGTEFKNRVMNQFCEMKGIKRVLVIKPHNKTPYELFLGRKPALSFMRPFGCPVTILNPIDQLGKFDVKADEGFFVGYSTNSKAFRVFNSKSRIIEENLHVKFSEDTPIITGNGPNWLFDIDALTKSMNYEPVVAGNQSNGIVGIKECENAGKARVETVSGKDYILLPFLIQDSPFSSSSKDSPDVGFKPSGEEQKDAKDLENEDSEVPNTEEPRVNQDQDANVNNTNNINTVSPTVNAVDIENNVVDENIIYGCDDDPNMPNLEKIFYSDNDEGVDAKADMTNLDTHILVSPTPTTRIHKDHPLEQIIGDIHSAPQTRRMTKNVTDHVPNEVMSNLNVLSLLVKHWILNNADGAFIVNENLGVHEISSGPIPLVADKTVIKEWEDRMERAATTASSLEAEQDMIQALVNNKKMIITKTSIRTNLKLEDAEGTDCLPTATIFVELERMRKQRKDSGPIEPIPDKPTNEETISTPSCDPPQSGEDRLQLTELMNLCTKLQKQVLDLEEAKTAQANEIASLKKRVKQLEQRKKSRTSGLKRKIADLDADAEVTMIDKTQERNDNEVNAADPVTTASEVVTTANAEVTTGSAPTTTIDELTLAQTLIEIKAAKPKAIITAATTTTTTRLKARGVVVQESNNTQAMIEADRLLAERLQTKEQEELADEEKVRLIVDILEKRKKHFTALRAK